MLDIINKAAITVIPKEPFIKWVQSTDAKATEISDESILSYSRVYLVDDSLGGGMAQKMDLRLFKQWFHVKVHEVVVDIGKKLPIAEEY